METQLIFPSQFDPDVHDRAIVDSLADEVKKLSERYERGREVLDKFGAWRSLWQEKLNFDEQSSSTNFYNNRGGVLNTLLKVKV